MDYVRHSVSEHHKKPLLEFITSGLEKGGCRILNSSRANSAPFRITFEDPNGQRHGIIVYAFFANSQLTKNRPNDEHRFQIKYGTKNDLVHQIWQDPYLLYTTLMVGIDTERGVFIGIDPIIHEFTKFFISIEFKHADVETTIDTGWHCWERNRRNSDDSPVETIVGGRHEMFFKYFRFEQAARGLDQGHRFLLAEKLDDFFERRDYGLKAKSSTIPQIARTHEMAAEFEISEQDILDMIDAAPRLKMAVRGWVAEHHLEKSLLDTEGVDSCVALEEDGRPDFEVVYRGSKPFLIECKNALRKTLVDGTIRVDFQKTRASKGDPCSRFYQPSDFEILAACLHPCTEKWEFAYRLTSEMELRQKNCTTHLNNNVKVTADWTTDAAKAFDSLLV